MEDNLIREFLTDDELEYFNKTKNIRRGTKQPTLPKLNLSTVPVEQACVVAMYQQNDEERIIRGFKNYNHKEFWEQRNKYCKFEKYI